MINSAALTIQILSGLLCVLLGGLLYGHRRQSKLLREANRSLAESQDHFRLVFEHSGVGMALKTPEGHFLQVNPALVQMFGYSAAEMSGRRLIDFTHPDESQSRVSGTELGLNIPSGMYEREKRYRRKDGQEVWARVLRVPLRNAAGKLRFIVSVFQDITQQRQVENQLRHAQKMEALGTLVGGIAHDFNNQLTIILGNIRLVLANLPDGCAGKTELIDAEEAGQRCADMTQGLLTFSQRRVGQLSTLNLNHLVTETVRLLQRVLPASITINMLRSEDPWPINADRTQLHQLIMNLAINARDAMPQGGTLTLATFSELVTDSDCVGKVDARPGRFSVLSVKDSGSGMSPEIETRIFEPFFTTKKPGKGTGLGLAMVFGIVKSHAGWISVITAPNRGAEFRIYLPAAETAELRATETKSEPVQTGRECILLVDDEELVRRLVHSILERRGFEVMSAGNGEEALTLYEKHGAAIDLVILDFTMPGMTGLQVLAELRKRNPSVRVVFSSGHTMNSDSHQLFTAGAQGFVAKPYRPEDLVSTIRQVLDEPLPEPDGAFVETRS